MPKLKANALTQIAVKALVDKGELGRHADGQGLYLHVTGKGAAKWSFRFMLRGKSREMGLGAEATTSLKDARTKARAAYSMVREGRDPLAEKEALEEARRAAEAEAAAVALAASEARSFKAAWEAWLEVNEGRFRHDYIRAKMKRQAELHILPKLGSKSVGSITADDVEAVLRPIWKAKPVLSPKVRTRIEQVLDLAIVNGWRPGPNPAVWKGNLSIRLGRSIEKRAQRHFRAMDWREVPAFMQQLAQGKAMSARALRWVILNAVRTTEGLGATWREIDRAAAGGPVWNVPAARMKMESDHRIPLSTEAMRLVDEQWAAAQAIGLAGPDDPVFPGAGGVRGGAGRALGAGFLTETALLWRLTLEGVRDKTTVHGFRSAFRDWVSECTSTPDAVAEVCLAHSVGTETTRAYQRGDMLEKRRVLMEQWAQFTLSKPAEVTPLPVVAATDDARPELPGEVIHLAGRRA